MDLFGDLPTAKKNSGGGGKGTSDDLFGGLPAAASSASGAGETNAQQIVKENTSAATDAKTSAAAAAGESSAVSSSDKRKSTASLVSAVGKAGTSLAFVPQAIAQARKKKKCPPQQQPTQKKVEPNKVNVDDLQETTGDAREKEQPESTAAVVTAKDHQSETNNIDQSYEEPYLENEPESTRRLHESVTPANAYNPHLPNDYLAHVERKKTEKLQKELQRSALQRLDHQEKLRKKIVEERRKIDSSGDVNKIVEMRAGIGGESANGMGGAGRGRGRGRGVQNLPAWLVKKQREQKKEAKKLSSSSNAPIGPDQFGDADDDDENCAITLLNLVAPGEIDEHLATEIREEFEEQSLKVVDIKIFDASSTCDLVRADIAFANGAAARNAVQLFNGRQFGGRPITAKIME